MKSELTSFYRLQRQIFGVCPECGELFRLSDCRVYLRKKPAPDWMDKIGKEDEKLDKREEKLGEIEEELREKSREKGRRLAKNIVSKVDPIFTPRRLDPDDAKVIFHPVDYIVFNGLSNESIKNIIFLDKETKALEQKKIQESIRETIEKEHYDWKTLRIADDGKMKLE